MRRPNLLFAVAAAALLGSCGKAEPERYGPDPKLPAPQRGLLPSMEIAEPAAWGSRRPVAPSGYVVTAIATGLGIPRQSLVLPNGDILVAEGRGGGAPALRPKDIIANVIKAKGTSPVKGGNRLTLLRDADGDGVYEGRSVFAENLNAPYGLALVGSQLYVANQDALVRFTYSVGQTRASAAPVKVTDLPAHINHHWTKSLAASPDGRVLYVGIGSNSNITERGMPAEADRAMIWEVDAATGAHRPYATGLRNPTALAIRPGTGELWAVVNERDEIGPNLVPDYLTFVRDGGVLWLALQLLGPERGPAGAATGSSESRRGDPAGLQPWLPRRRPWIGLLGDRHGRAVRRRRVRGRARQLEPKPAGRLQGRIRALPQRTACRPAHRLPHGVSWRRWEDPRTARRCCRGPARRPDRRRRPLKHDLAGHACRPCARGRGARGSCRGAFRRRSPEKRNAVLGASGEH